MQEKGCVCMKKKSKQIAALLLLLIVTAVVIIYRRPMTLEELYPNVDLSCCESIRVYHHVHTKNHKLDDEPPVVLLKGSEPFCAVMEEVRTRTFRKSLWNLLPSGGKSHALREGDFKWELIFRVDDVTFPDGSIGSGDIVQLKNFYGTLEYFSLDGRSVRCSTEHQEEWLEKIQSILSAAQ